MNSILLISCPDQKGITAAVTNFIYQNNGNILHADQHIDDQTNTFFMRVSWSNDGFAIQRDRIEPEFSKIAERFKMDWELYFTDKKIRMAIFVSKQLHCLYDLLWRKKSGQLGCEIPVIISNHDDARGLADEFGVEYMRFAISKDNKQEQEQKELEVLKNYSADLVVLARYHQILSPFFIQNFNGSIINIHHSFLPAFAGAAPYAQAYERGVKIIGATAHYVTEQLDQGPIIEQGTTRVSHRDTVDDLIRKGEDLERIVLNQAVRWHLEQKILRYGNKTVVFD
jgi:formyltetrahydrofolate deformylase